MSNKGTFPICEIFKSISGEGITTGFPATFVRVGGCNLCCTYCDTSYTQPLVDEAYQQKSMEEIVAFVKRQGLTQVICTGGEPLLNPVREIPLALAASGFTVRVETNGSVPLYLPEEVGNSKINYALDVKCPSSAMEDQDILDNNISLLNYGDELKFVLSNKEDFAYALMKITPYVKRLSEIHCVLNFSCVFGLLSLEALGQMLLEKALFFEKHGLSPRLSLQLHKVIWDPSTRGV